MPKATHKWEFESSSCSPPTFNSTENCFPKSNNESTSLPVSLTLLCFHWRTWNSRYDDSVSLSGAFPPAWNECEIFPFSTVAAATITNWKASVRNNRKQFFEKPENKPKIKLLYIPVSVRQKFDMRDMKFFGPESVLQFRLLLSGRFRKQEQGSDDMKWFIFFRFSVGKSVIKTHEELGDVAGLELSVLSRVEKGKLSRKARKFHDDIHLTKIWIFLLIIIIQVFSSLHVVVVRVSLTFFLHNSAPFFSSLSLVYSHIKHPLFLQPSSRSLLEEKKRNDGKKKKFST